MSQFPFHQQAVFRFYCYDALINICEPYLFVFHLNATAIAANIFKYGRNTSIVFQFHVYANVCVFYFAKRPSCPVILLLLFILILY